MDFSALFVVLHALRIALEALLPSEWVERAGEVLVAAVRALRGE